MGRLAIIIIAAVGLYALVATMRGPEDAPVSAMPDAETEMSSKADMMKEDMTDNMADNMADTMDTMPKMSREQETRQLLAELKTIPVSEYAANKSRYERLLELHPGNETFLRKVNFYRQKLQERRSAAGY